MSEAELENFILKYLSTKKFSKTEKLFSKELSRKRKKSTSNNFILEEKFEKLQKYFFNVKETDNNNSTTKRKNDESSDDFEEIDNLISKFQSRNGIQLGRRKFQGFLGNFTYRRDLKMPQYSCETCHVSRYS